MQEFTVHSAFNPAIHMTISDIQSDSLVNPSYLKVHMKCSKTDPFRKACDIYLGQCDSSICPLRAIGNYLHVRGSVSGPLFLFQDGSPLSHKQLS